MHTHAKKISVVLCAGLAGALSIALPSHAGSAYKNKSGSYPHTFVCQNAGQPGDGDKLVYTGPDTMWPPNHKTQMVMVQAIADKPDPTTGESIMGFGTVVTNDDVGQGSGNPHLDDTNNDNQTTVDGTGTLTHAFYLRAERSGTSASGRTYTIAVSATFADGSDKPCTTSWAVTVPHDMGN